MKRVLNYIALDEFRKKYTVFPKVINYCSGRKQFSSGSIDSTIRRFWAKWVLSVGVVSLVFSVTLMIAPFLHKDEFIIVDLGRVILHPHTNWSINWLTAREEPVFVWFYIGPILQEFCYQIMGQYGPRLSGLLGGLAAATVMVGWLLSRGTTRRAAFLLGLVFLLDPLFVQAYTMRVDGWAMSLCIASCWVLRNTYNNILNKESIHWQVMLAGAILAIAFFTWPSAAYLVPLILVELLSLASKFWTIEKNRKKVITIIFLFGIGSILTSVLLLIPIAPYLYTHLGNMIAGLQVNTQAGPEWGVLSGMKRQIAPFLGMVSYLKFTSVLFILSLICIIKQRQFGLAIAALAATLMILATIVYIHRVLYLVPYFIVAVANIYQEKYKQNTKLISYLGKELSLVLLLGWGVGLSLIARPVLAFQAKAERDRSLIYKAASSRIGEGNHKVLLLSSVEYYYAGRSLGWNMYAPYIAMGEPLSSTYIKQVLPHIDYVIMPQQSSKEIDQQFRQAGWYDKSNYTFYKDPVETFNGKTTNIWRLRFLYAIYEQPYGPYTLYVRNPNQTTAN